MPGARQALALRGLNEEEPVALNGEIHLSAGNLQCALLHGKAVPGEPAHREGRGLRSRGHEIFAENRLVRLVARGRCVRDIVRDNLHLLHQTLLAGEHGVDSVRHQCAPPVTCPACSSGRFRTEATFVISIFAGPAASSRAAWRIAKTRAARCFCTLSVRPAAAM